MTNVSPVELAHVTGGTFRGEGPFLTEVLRRGLRGGERATAHVPRPKLKKSDVPGWCDDGFGIVPCR